MDANAKQTLNDMFAKCEQVIQEVLAGTMKHSEAFQHLMYHVTYARMNPWLYLERDGGKV